MKKLCLAMVLVMLFSMVCAFAESVDLSGLSDDELIELDFQIQEEISNRDNFMDSILYPGKYIVGEDLEEGEYIVKCLKLINEDYVYGYVELYPETEPHGDSIDYSALELGDEYRLKLTKGNCITIGQALIGYVKRK